MTKRGGDGLKDFNENFVDAHANANIAATEGSTIALCERCSG